MHFVPPEMGFTRYFGITCAAPGLYQLYICSIPTLYLLYIFFCICVRVGWFDETIISVQKILQIQMNLRIIHFINKYHKTSKNSGCKNLISISKNLSNHHDTPDTVTFYVTTFSLVIRLWAVCQHTEGLLCNFFSPIILFGQYVHILRDLLPYLLDVYIVSFREMESRSKYDCLIIHVEI
jgi:hypothetical protein